MVGLVGRAVSSGSRSWADWWESAIVTELGLGVEWGGHRVHRVPAES